MPLMLPCAAAVQVGGSSTGALLRERATVQSSTNAVRLQGRLRLRVGIGEGGSDWKTGLERKGLRLAGIVKGAQPGRD